MSHKKELLDLADKLDKAERQGFKTDEPEGSRYILVSDTMAKELSEAIRAMALAIFLYGDNK